MPKRKPQSNDGMQMVNVRVPRTTVARLRLVAEAEHRTVSQEVRRLIDLRLAEADEKEAA